MTSSNPVETTQKQLVIIGNGMVGHRFVIDAIAKGLHKTHDIHVFSEEPLPAYDRVQLSSYFENQDIEMLNLVDLAEYHKSSVQLHLGEGVAQVERDEKKIITTKGRSFSYDTLVFATGSYPFVPPVPGADNESCFVYRTIDDLDKTIACAKGKKKGVVVGGGLLGLEAAKALVNLGLETYVVEFAPQLMGVQLDPEGGALLKSKIEAMGVHVLCSKNTKEIIAGEESVLRMNFADGSHLETDMIVFSAGIRPQDALAKSCGLNIGERGGVVINNHCQTSDKNVYAIGECALWEKRIFGLVAPGYSMASVAAAQIAGDSAQCFEGADMSTKLKLLGVEVGSIGDARAQTEGAQVYSYTNPREAVYKKLVTNKDGTRLIGAILVGDTSDYGNLLQLFLNDMDLPKEPEALILPNVDGAPTLGVDALPESAQICSCYNVSKGELCSAVVEGCHDLGDLKLQTGAATGCGGCKELVKDVFNTELIKLGVEVNDHICEHFPYSRQELYHLVRVGEIKTFKSLIAQHGSGYGCEICKPAAASIFASCWNEHILEPAHVGLQDSNDVFLGNIQKNGTYSVVPRVPAGEILPDQLIALGQVAKKYDLYSKVTGGQRVDLFGARMEDLPAIWGELIDAGFETGHAYAKSLRTVKSCVGSTWCRYGVDDSVGLAIDLENRYKGLRSPHKLKMGVSGCTRECAEAQSKDVGVIATERGWNLYVCGNGGMRPRHADLLAEDLDRETLIRYIDRLFMFYIKTADRLQRTSVWFEKLEGGLDYLRDVVCHDSLGIARDLETQMQSVVDTYQCEWKTAISDSEKLKRFTHFVNSDERDSNVVFVDERKQRRPATEHEKIIAKAG